MEQKYWSAYIFHKKNLGIDVSHLFHMDMYEGTRMAREEVLPGTEKTIRPLEESGVVARRTDKDVIIQYCEP